MSARLYDDLDLLYREIWGTSLHHGLWRSGQESCDEARAQLIDEVLHLLEPSGVIADIGCGYGDLSLKLAGEFGCTVHACTNSLKQAEAFPPHDRITVHAGDWVTHGLPTASLDQAVAVESLSHFASFAEFSEQTAFALRPGGILVIADWFGNGNSGTLLNHLAKSGDLPDWRSAEEFFETARRYGFVIESTQEISRNVAPTWTALFWKSCALPFQKPSLLPTLIRQGLRRPSLLWSFPLLRWAYRLGSLKYHLIRLRKSGANSSRPLP